MLRNTLATLGKSATRRSYSDKAAAQSLAEEALKQKTGGQFKATLPKGDKKPAKAAGAKDSYWKSIAIGTGATTGALMGGLFYYGRPFADGREDKEMHQPMWDQLLPDPLPEPYRRPYTLVINLDETLVYSTWSREHGWRHAKRPGVDYFLSYLSQFYEIVIFTSQPAMNAMPILDKLDPYQYAMYRLYRDGTRYVDGQYIKDISHLNRDLSKVIIMDSNPHAFSLQPENGVALKPWKGEANDQGLLEYIPFLEAVALTNPTDIRPVLQSFGDSHIPEEWAKREADMNEQHRQQWLAEQQGKPSNRNLGSLLRGGGAAGAPEGPPPTYLEQMRAHVRETFAQEHEAMKGQPLMPPGQEQQQPGQGQ
ncbi:hypothetical protein [Absidia glauca]|uniref:Mitochondrial import inner membrane translocase subunit TIM50 n=1 Tax=Absidia glauca TaxID=4829 RepID=A0A168P266_ABSGL|nr:hypothetical protein [Absidia glauca]